MADTVQQRIFSAEQIVVKSEFPKILLEFSKEVIRQGPQDIIQFSREYFEQKLEETGFFKDNMNKLDVNIKTLVFQNQKIYSRYTIGQVIGDVTRSKARVATDKKTGQQKAVKIYDKSTIPDINDYKDHVNLQASLDHPNILTYSEVYEDKDYIYMVNDYMRGGELDDAIIAKGSFNEYDAAYIIKQLLQAIAYLHGNGIVHRNICPRNILLREPSKLDLKLIDFDFAGIKTAGKEFFDKMQGDPAYEAPEVFKNEYNDKSDVWSLGIVLYHLLSGSLPFNGWTTSDTILKVVDGNYDLDSDIWYFVSEDAKDMVRLMLTYDYQERPSAEDLLQHPWIQNLAQGKSKDLSKALENIYEFNAGNKLKQSVLAFFAKNLLTDKEMNELAAQFSAIDKNGNGRLSRDEIIDAYREIKGIDFDEQEVDELIRNVDADGSGEIEYQEWIMTAINKEKLITKEKLEQAFVLFDKNGDKQISYDEIVALLHVVKNIDSDAVERAVAEIDNKGKGNLTFKEFKKLIEKLFES